MNGKSYDIPTMIMDEVQDGSLIPDDIPGQVLEFSDEGSGHHSCSNKSVTQMLRTNVARKLGFNFRRYDFWPATR